MAADAIQNNAVIESKSGLKPRQKLEEQDRMEIQVPATQPQFNPEDVTSVEPPEINNDEGTHLSNTLGVEELSKLDRKELEQRCIAELLAQNAEENKLKDMFDNCYAAFENWSQAGVIKANERASKRLKTLANYVEMSEQDIAQKKISHKAVVDAFKQALTLIPKRV